jgi:hypothetical protein
MGWRGEVVCIDGVSAAWFIELCMALHGWRYLRVIPCIIWEWNVGWWVGWVAYIDLDLTAESAQAPQFDYAPQCRISKLQPQFRSSIDLQFH